MFKLKIELGTLKDFIMIVDSLVDELKLNITKDGIGYRCVDPAHVCMAVCDIRPGAFESYDVDEDATIGIDIKELKSVFKLGKSKDIMYISGDSTELHIKINNSFNKLTLIDTTSLSDPKVPDTKFENHVVINTLLFKGILGRCCDVSDFVALNINKNGFRIFSSGDVSVADSKISKTELISYECHDESLSYYALTYLYKIIKSLNFRSLDLRFGVDYPIKIEFAEHYMYGLVLLAPRITDEPPTIPDDDPNDYNTLDNDDLW